MKKKLPFVKWFIKKNNVSHITTPRWKTVRPGERDSHFLLNSKGKNEW